jgi:hypothetical protein
MRIFRKVWNSYEHVYSAGYKWQLKRWAGDDEMASRMTAIALAGALSANCALAVLIFVLFHGPLPLEGQYWPAVLPVGGAFLLNYMAFVRADRYRKVVQRFDRRSSQARRRATILAWVYILFSYLAPGVFAFTVAR